MVVKTCVAGRICGIRLLTKITIAPVEQISFEKKGEIFCRSNHNYCLMMIQLHLCKEMQFFIVFFC